VNKNGKIIFTKNMNITKNADFTNTLKISSNKVLVDSNSIPEFNSTSELTINDVNLKKPIIKIDGVDCPSTICQNVGFNSNTRTFTFSATRFSVYEVVEQCSDGIRNYDELGVDCSGSCFACFIIPVVPATTSGGGGGGTISGGGITIKELSVTPSVLDSKDVTEADNESPVILNNFDIETGVKEIQIEVNNAAKDIKVTVSKYEEKPADVSKEKTGKIYRYLRIETENLENNIKNASLNFQVEKIWASANNIDKNNVAIFKFFPNENRWTELNTSYTGSDENYHYYKTELTGFSYFVIGEKEEVSVSENVGINTLEKKLFIGLMLIIFFAIIVLIILIARKLREAFVFKKIMRRREGNI
jgi:PGF-pre-PGF domain-containing protein